MQLDRLGTDIEVAFKGEIDLVTDVDLAVEAMFRSVLAERFPDHQILGEELGSRGDGDSGGYCWIFDPIDGTTNYAHGLPVFCASLGVELEGQPVVAAIYDPTRRELFTAERDEGARLNGSPLSVSRAATLSRSLLVTGFPYDVHERVDEVVGLFGAFIARSRAVRRLGSAALDLCYVAAGRMDGFWEQWLKPWDTAAGVLIVREAGGRITGPDGRPFSSRDGYVVASNGLIHDEMLSTIRDFNARRSRNRTN
jgi:myo-inositol-1(or 4)-monophosphatase